MDSFANQRAHPTTTMRPFLVSIVACGAMISRASPSSNDGGRGRGHRRDQRERAVFGLGAGRTGTDSLREALTELGLGPTYHMRELMVETSGVSTRGHVERWHRAALGNATDEDWTELTRRFPSGVDWPLSAFPEDLLARFPRARFVLTVRPNASEWYDSLRATVCHMQLHHTVPYLLRHLPFAPFDRKTAQQRMLDDLVRRRFAPGTIHSFEELCTSPRKSMDAYDAWNERVINLIPKKQLLIFKTGEHGYEELCRFLNVQVPDKPYPRGNGRRYWKFTILKLQLLCAFVYVVLPVVLIMTLCVLVRRTNKHKVERKED